MPQSFRRAAGALAFLCLAPLAAAIAAPAHPAAVWADGDIAGSVTDSSTGRPLPGGDVRVLRGTEVIAVTTTDAFGRFTIHNLPAGDYTVDVRYLGFRAGHRDVTVAGAEGLTALDFPLAPVPIEIAAVEVTTAVPLAVDTRTGDQIFKQNDYHGAPTNTTSQILQQSIVGAARATTGEVHIRGQHAEYTYYVDGVPVPAGISGSLNELFDPQVVNQIDFQGSFTTNGQAMNASTNAGKWGFFVSGAHQATDMRREPVVFDTLRNAVGNFHNNGSDLFGFAKAQYVASDRDVINVDVNRSRTRFAVPFDSSAGIIDDHQQDVNGFVNLGWRHRVGAGTS